MTEKEKLILAQKYIDYLARGFNPLDESPIGVDDVVRNIRISRCLVYVSEVLGEVIEKGICSDKPIYSKSKKEEFNISYEAREKFTFSDKPITVSEISQGLSDLIDTENIKKLQASAINSWLVENGFLKETVDYNGKSKKCVTEEGFSLGIIEVEKISQAGMPYKAIKHSRASQEFIIDNLDAIIEHNRTKSIIKKAEKQAKRERRKGFVGNELIDEVICDLLNAGATAEEIANTTGFDLDLIIERIEKIGY